MQLRTLKFIQIAIPLAVALSAVFFAIALGVEEKPWWQDAFGLIGGGTLGAIAGLGFFVVVGAVGWVSGPVFGAIGVVGLVASGALGGMGLGAIVDKVVDIASDPGSFNFDASKIAAIVSAGGVAAWILHVLVGRQIDRLKADSRVIQMDIQ